MFSVPDLPPNVLEPDYEIAVEARNLTKRYGEGDAAVLAVDDVNLKVSRGDVTLIMGPSGSGKTTLLTMLGGLLRPTSGSITIHGVELTDLTEKELPELRRNRIGFVFQSFNLLEALTVAQNVEVAMNLAGVKGRPARERARKLLEQVGLEKRMKFRPSQLSGGEKQRVSIARALANRAPVILADEPTANLDARNGSEIVRMLANIALIENRTLIVVSHDPRVQSAADHVYWLEDGRLTRGGRNA